ncbi:MAG: NAD(P)-dependent oxidoreductase [Nitrospiraceae bacterium]|nr:NAD(P)-dependent oxidoreductase [Nitrospiraceae bacterium]
MIKIFVTGGSGFIGRNLVEQWAGKYAVYAPPSSEVNLLDSDVVRDYIVKNRFDVVIHAATWDATRNSGKDLSKVLDHNMRMFFNVARCNGYFGKMLYYGSGAEYDRAHWKPHMKEEYFDVHVPGDDYGFSKYVMAKYAGRSDNIYNLRLFGVFGKYEDWEVRFISNACCKAAWDLPITLKQNVYFDYLHIDDLLTITGWFVEHKPEEKIYNICTGRTVDLLTLARMVVAASGKTLDIVVERNGLGTEYSGDNGRLAGEIEDLAFGEIGECIDALYKWYAARREELPLERLLQEKWRW